MVAGIWGHLACGMGREGLAKRDFDLDTQVVLVAKKRRIVVECDLAHTGHERPRREVSTQLDRIVFNHHAGLESDALGKV